MEAMKRRSRAGSKPAKARPRKALEPKGRSAPKALSHRGAAPALKTEVARLTRELREAVERQAATADLLKAMGRSAIDLQGVLDTLVRSAARLTQAEMGSLVQPEGSVFRQLASCGYPQELDEFMQTHPVPLGRGTITGRTLIEGKPVQVADVLADPEFTFIESVKIGGMRTMLGVPLLRDGVPIGVIVLSRRIVLPFSDAQIEVVQNFAAQAVIAIENARLLNELHQRTADLSESLEQQTATSDVLKVISNSPGDLDPVFTSMLENAIRICDATFGNIYRWDGEVLHLLASHNTPPALAEARKRSPVHPYPKHLLVTWLRTKQHLTWPTWQHCRVTLTAAMRVPLHLSNLGACGRFWRSQCSRKTNWSVRSFFPARRCGHSATSRSLWSPASPLRPSSPSRMLVS